MLPSLWDAAWFQGVREGGVGAQMSALGASRYLKCHSPCTSFLGLTGVPRAPAWDFCSLVFSAACVCVCPPGAIRFKNTIRCNLCNRQVEHNKGNCMWKSRRFCPGSLQTGLAHTTGPSFRVSSSPWSASELSLLCDVRKLMG